MIAIHATAPDTTRILSQRGDTLVLFVRRDTVVRTSPPLPAIHDTVRVVQHDTVSVGQPVLPPGVLIYDPNGERKIYYNNQFLGRLVFNTDNTVAAYRYSTPNTLMHSQGNYLTQIMAIVALMLPAPLGFVP